MPRNKINSLVEELQSELQKADSIDPELLKKLNQDLEALSSSNSNIEETEASPFLEAAVHFEEEHPKAATILNDIAYLLTNIGI